MWWPSKKALTKSVPGVYEINGYVGRMGREGGQKKNDRYNNNLVLSYTRFMEAHN
jgi:hypothetical protein